MNSTINRDKNVYKRKKTSSCKDTLMSLKSRKKKKAYMLLNPAMTAEVAVEAEVDSVVTVEAVAEEEVSAEAVEAIEMVVKDALTVMKMMMMYTTAVATKVSISQRQNALLSTKRRI